MTWAFLLYGRPYGVVQGEAIMYLTNGKILVIIRNDVCVAQLDRALGYGPRCRGFESSHARWLIKRDRLDGLSLLIVRVRVGHGRVRVCVPLRSAQSECPPDILRPLTHVKCFWRQALIYKGLPPVIILKIFVHIGSHYGIARFTICFSRFPACNAGAKAFQDSFVYRHRH